MSYTEYSAAQAVERANAITTWQTAMCLGFTRHCLRGDKTSGLYDANAAWAAAKQKEYDTPPAGAPVYFAGYAHGHIAISLGGGFIRSTDVPTLGRVGRINIGDIERDWGIKYRGWSRDYAGLLIRGLEETTTNYGGVPTLPTSPTPAPAPQEDIVATIADLEAALKRVVPGIVDARLDALLADPAFAEAMWTRHRIVKNVAADDPTMAPRVTPSNLLERSSLDTKVYRTGEDPTSALQEIADGKTIGRATAADVAAIAAAVAELTKKVDALPKG